MTKLKLHFRAARLIEIPIQNLKSGYSDCEIAKAVIMFDAQLVQEARLCDQRGNAALSESTACLSRL